MKKNELVKIIELVVRKEIKKQLSEIFINEQKEVKLSDAISKPKPKKVVKPKKQYSKDKMLNEVLNNTTPLGQQETDEYPTLGGGVLGSDNINLGDDRDLESAVLGKKLLEVLTEIVDIIENTNIGAGGGTLPLPFSGKLKQIVSDKILSKNVKLK